MVSGWSEIVCGSETLSSRGKLIRVAIIREGIKGES